MKLSYNYGNINPFFLASRPFQIVYPKKYFIIGKNIVYVAGFSLILLGSAQTTVASAK